MKIIVYDIETAPIVGTFWQLRKPYLTHSNILRDANILTAAWKICGEGSKVNAVWVDPSHPDDDKELLKNLRIALVDADILVAHNGDKFDLPWIQSRLLFHKLKPLPPIRTVDTYKVAKAKFRFTSNRLDYLGRYLGLGCKIKTDYDLWMDIVEKRSATALAKMVKYNKQDVLLLEDVYYALRPWMTSHPNLRLLDGRSDCPLCGVGSLEKRGYRYTKKTAFQRYCCKSCGGWSSGEVVERSKIA